MKSHLIIAAISGALLSTPLLAQTAPATAPAAEAGDKAAHPKRDLHRARAKSNVSAEGRTILREVMKDQHRPENRQKLKDARERISTILAADKLDVAALRQAMAAERQLVISQHQQRQEALIAAAQKLTPADRKAFAAEAHTGRQHMKRRMDHRGVPGHRAPSAEQTQPAPQK